MVLAREGGTNQVKPRFPGPALSRHARKRAKQRLRKAKELAGALTTCFPVLFCAVSLALLGDDKFSHSLYALC